MSTYKGLHVKKGKLPKGLANYMSKKKSIQGPVGQNHGIKPMPKTGNVKPTQAGNNMPSNKGFNPFFKKVDKTAKKTKGKTLRSSKLKTKKY